jgi:hypothetical protein
MNYKLISNKTSVKKSTNEISTLNLEWEFTNFQEAYNKYESHVKEHSIHVATLIATHIVHSITIVSIATDGTQIAEAKILLSN